MTEWLSGQNRDAPGTVADLDFVGYFQRGDVYDRNVISGAVGGVECPPVMRDPDAPRTPSDIDGAHNLLGGCVNDEHFAEPSRTDVYLLAVRSDCNPHRLHAIPLEHNVS